ncbi:MAG: type II toxin-antitoxin system RelE/ParE family toxin [Gulosibacter sp.]|uniref:type II toxin-antitoxin system RelE/ParE family toxin n=1 Tax=Gulosibacter sp. TaxID=2817531 RepID=UPI003F9377E2
MSYRVTFSLEARQHLTDIFLWIAAQDSSEAAEHFVMSIYEYCDSLSGFPCRGMARDDLFRE